MSVTASERQSPLQGLAEDKARQIADDPHRVDITYVISEQQMVRVKDVIYLGQKRTQLSLIKKTTNTINKTLVNHRADKDANSRGHILV